MDESKQDKSKLDDKIQRVNIEQFLVGKTLNSLNEKRYLNFREMNDLNYDIHYKGNFFKDKNIQTIFNLAKSIDAKIWIVGGAIRDFFSNKAITDIDFVTNMEIDLFVKKMKNHQNCIYKI